MPIKRLETYKFAALVGKPPMFHVMQPEEAHWYTDERIARQRCCYEK